MTAVAAELAWREGDTATAIETADRILTEGTDQDCVAAGVAAAAAAADGALFDAAARWRVIAGSLSGAPGVAAAARAALAGCLAGDLDAAARDLADARARLSGAAPRGLTVLLDGVDAALEAVRGGFSPAARKLAGLAAATVPADPMAADPMAAEQWGDLAITALIAGGHDATAEELLLMFADRPTARRRLLTAWLHLRAGRLSAARTEIAACTALLARTRLLTLTGFGGSGKTRLAVELARRTLEERPDGAWFVDLAPVRDPSRIEAALAAAITVREEPGRSLTEAAHSAGFYDSAHFSRTFHAMFGMPPSAVFTRGLSGAALRLPDQPKG